MKWRYMLRGMGIGILLGGGAMALWGGGASMSDQQIRERALALGMVEAITLSQAREAEESPAPGVSGGDGEAEAGTVAPTVAQEAENNVQAGEESGAAPGAEPTAALELGAKVNTVLESVAESEPGAEAALLSVELAKPSGEQTDAGAAIYMVEVQAGDSATMVGKRLESVGLVEDGMAFGRYLRSKGYDTRVQVGIFALHKDMSNEEMADILLTYVSP